MFRCGHCGGQHPFEPHPTRPAREVAYCDGRAVCERNVRQGAPRFPKWYQDRLELIPGVGPELARALRLRGYRTLAGVDWATDEALLEIPGIGQRKLKQIRQWFNQRGGE